MRPVEISQPAVLQDTGTFRGLVVEMRPQEWVKNLLVFSGVIFSRSLTDAHNILISVLGVLLFCAASSGIYLFNDLCDLSADREHPIKKNRPLASGSLNVNAARVAMFVLLTGAAAGSLALSRAFAVTVAIYLTICLAYSIKLKDVVILDVILISSGFVLRAVAGAVLIGVAVSDWLVLCTSMVALLIAFGKRRHELVLLEEDAGNHRVSLNEYSVGFLDSIMAICSGAALITYALYTMAEETAARVGSKGMLVTIPFVVYGIFRYLFLIHRRQAGGDPVKILFGDGPTLLNLLLWIATVGVIIYAPHFWSF